MTDKTPTTYADRVEQAANLVKDGYAYAADTVKPYAGETVANALKTTGEYGAAGVTKTGELVGLKKDHPVEGGVNAVKDSMSGTGGSTQDTLGSAQAKVDDAIGKPSGKTYVDHASDTAKPYLDEASKQADMAYKDPQGYAKSTYEYATGQSAGTGTGTSGGSTLDSAKGTAGGYADKASQQADAAYKNPGGYAEDTYKSVTGSGTGTGTGTGGSSGSTFESAKDTVGSYANKAGQEADAAYKNPGGYADQTYKSATGSGTGTGMGTGSGSSGSAYQSAKDTVGGYADQAGKQGEKFSSDPQGYSKSTYSSATENADKGLGSGSVRPSAYK